MLNRRARDRAAPRFSLANRPRGRQTTSVITMRTRDHPLDVSLRPMLDAPGLVSITFRRDKELLCQAIVARVALTDALGRCEAEMIAPVMRSQ
jgi:hypothetical protein